MIFSEYPTPARRCGTERRHMQGRQRFKVSSLHSFRRLGFLLLVSSFLPPPASADDESDARQILKNVASTYQSSKPMSFARPSKTSAVPTLSSAKWSSPARGPGKFRIEEQTPMANCRPRTAKIFASSIANRTNTRNPSLSAATRTPLATSKKSISKSRKRSSPGRSL